MWSTGVTLPVVTVLRNSQGVFWSQHPWKGGDVVCVAGCGLGVWLRSADAQGRGEASETASGAGPPNALVELEGLLAGLLCASRCAQLGGRPAFVLLLCVWPF